MNRDLENDNIVGQRIRELRDKSGMMQDELADKLGVKRANISKYEHGRVVPPGDILVILANLFHTTTDYLLGKTDDPFPSENKISYMPPQHAELVEIPIYGEIRAGYNSLAESDIIGYEVVSRDSVRDGEYFYLIVKGDSMIEEGIFPGMKVLVKSQPTCKHGKIGVVLVNGDEGTLKRVYYENDSVILKAANKNIEPRTLPLSEVYIQGQVKQVIWDV
ncbi:LexA family protein [Paenibacillus cymbidii]|uniref:LexA family protein n=1 Tax=Paenibacillus cymbidii TaxID=1639034 RepID=UPI001080E0B7|nr:LexA family transcriptional regulator [Paenibacillus cymbidii]